ncbi:MAG: hypothetical protein JWQ90_5225 [Hydrocarboniphaga sp.]|uniref:TonB-dependent receptor n=1 Tax=Hydrocarboniphaga sp. TaxID=2033016 RepID=UPI002623F017|nr:TonB-dependent receptor [Hydrocarboniphaga sp.]MDB5972775.1 hypothetical protein [Hydrocarboniphaga sp.]
MKRIINLGLALAGSLSLPALGQTAPAPSEPAQPAATAQDDGRIEEVIVTAQRREEKLQEVPLAVSAFSSDQLESRGIANIADLSALSPGLQISKTPSNSTISQISIRGVTQINPAIYWDPAVGVYVDGVYIGKAQGSIFDVVDLAAVEVLRGPQGTLYGRNTMAGTINLRTKAPSGVFGGSASFEVGNYDAMVQKATVDLPKIGIASISLGVRSERRDGWVTTSKTSPTNDLNDRHNDAIRLAMDLDFSDTVKGEYRFDRSNVDQSNNWDQLVRADAAFFDAAGLVGFAGYASQNRLEHADIDAPSFEESKVLGHSLTLSWNVDEHNTLKSITGYRRLEWNDSLDLDGSPYPVAFTQRFTDYDQLSQDLQLLGAVDRWNYVAGLYYFGDDGSTNNPQSFFGGGSTFDSRYSTQSKAYAAYGQIDFKPIEAMTLSAGLRYTSEKKELSRVLGCNQAAFGNPYCTPAEGESFVYLIPEGSTNPSKTFSATTPMAAVAYRFNETINVYARYAEGFKSGGFNGEYSNTFVFGATQEELAALNQNETNTPFKPEKQKSIELGTKTTWLSGRALFNLALFHSKLEDLQTSTFLGGSESAAGTVIRNAGAATVQGVEIEAVLIPVRGTQLRLSYSYLDAEYDRFEDGGINQADNRAFVHAPKNTFNAVIDSVMYRAAWGNVRGVLDYSYTSSIYTYPYQLDGSNPAAQTAANSRVDAYSMLNARIGLADCRLGDKASGDLFLWVRNLTDEDTASNFIDFGPGFGNLTVANFIEPRTYGVTATVRW